MNDGKRYITVRVHPSTVRGLDLIRSIRGFDSRGAAVDYLIDKFMLIPGVPVADIPMDDFETGVSALDDGDVDS